MRRSRNGHSRLASHKEAFTPFNWQDTFRVEYHQLDPLKRFPILDVHDIQEQREVELYLGNLAPGRDFAISVTSLREELPSQPWRGIVTTRQLKFG